MKLFRFAYRVETQQNLARRALTSLVVAGLWTLLPGTPAFSQGATPAVSCESLTKLQLPEMTITMAEPVAAGQFKEPASADAQPSGPGGPGGSGAQNRSASGGPPQGGQPSGPRGPFGTTDTSQLPSFCRVAATLTPSGDSDIKMEIWLPMNWNGRFMGAGNWGWAGSIRYDGLEMGLKDGYAVASNDTGHTKADGQTGEFAIGHPDKVIDYGWRANHAMTLNAKAIIKNFYGVGPEHSYWVGCSLGGQQGMTEIQRFPYDYDGAVIGQPAWPIIQLNAAQIWPALLARQNPEGLLSAGKLAMVQEAIKKACATPEDLKLGYLGDPASCHFDPKTLLCKGADSDNCLTAAQVDMIEKVHNGLINPRTGEHITLPEIGWGAGAGFSSIRVGVSQGQENPMQVAVGLYKYLVFQDPNWDWTTLDMDKDLDFAEKVLSTVNKADNPNLKPFFDLGGKLLLYESTAATTNYYKEVLKTVGPEAKDSIRAFNMEGMAHCGGGTGCDQFDKLGVIDRWVGGGKAPDEIVAFKGSDNKVTHLLCAYPNVAKYKGTGDVKDADSFICGE